MFKSIAVSFILAISSVSAFAGNTTPLMASEDAVFLAERGADVSGYTICDMSGSLSDEDIAIMASVRAPAPVVTAEPDCVAGLVPFDSCDFESESQMASVRKQ